MHHIPSKSYQQLQPEERMTIASLLQQRCSITQIAQRLKRSAVTISGELKRNAQDGCYASQVATTCTRQRRRSGRPAKKLHAEGILFGGAHHFLNQRWSPEQIALKLASIYPIGPGLRVSSETIYNCTYAQPVGQLKKDLIQALRHARNKRVPRSKGQDRRGQILDMLSIAPPMRHSMTYDQGLEMAFNKELNHNTGIAGYYCDAYSPWQRGSNENMNGLVNQYLPKGTDLSVYSQEQLDAIADQINKRSRKGLWVCDPQWRCTQNCCATANNIQRSNIKQCSVTVHF